MDVRLRKREDRRGGSRYVWTIVRSSFDEERAKFCKDRVRRDPRRGSGVTGLTDGARIQYYTFLPRVLSSVG